MPIPVSDTSTVTTAPPALMAARVMARLREKARVALKKLAEEESPELKFDVLWAVDNSGRVIAAAAEGCSRPRLSTSRT